MVSNSRRTPRAVHVARWVFAVLVSAPVLALVAHEMALRWHDREIVAADIEQLFQAQDRGEKLPPPICPPVGKSRTDLYRIREDSS